jgi:two-component system, NtrC family, response regulator PilR
VERATALAVGPAIGIGDLPREVSGQAAAPTAALGDLSEQGCMLDDVLGEFERRLILQALARTGGVRTTAAKLLGVSFRSLRYRMAKLGFADDDSDASEAASDSEPSGAVSSSAPLARRSPDNKRASITHALPARHSGHRHKASGVQCASDVSRHEGKSGPCAYPGTN